MTDLETSLYFNHPALTLRDIRVALSMHAAYGTRPDFLTIVESQFRVFDNYRNVLNRLKDFYGQEKNKESHKKETTQENIAPETRLKEALAQEKIFKGKTFKEKEIALKIKKKFQGRFIQSGGD